MPLENATSGLWKDYVVISEDDDRREAIVKTVGQRFAAILVANGYKTDLGENVFRDRTADLDPDDELPGLIYRDVECVTTVQEMHRHRMTMEVNLYCAEGADTSAMLNKMRADLMLAIGQDLQWSDRALNTYPGKDIKIVEQLDEIIGRMTVEFVIEFRTLEWNPYA